jgi:hypothetical protein
MTYELVPPKEHQCNMAEKAIQTFKDHFVGVLSGCAPSMLIHLWCQLLPQVKRQLLLPPQSCVHPNLSAYAHIYKHHDYNRHPFVPIGMEALVHDKPHKRCTYAEHCTKAFVLGTSTKHYQCWKFCTPTTHATCISGTVFFKHKYITDPSIMPEDQVIAAAARLTDTLQGIKSPQLHTSTLQALGDLHDVFFEAANATKAPLFAANTSPRQVAPLPPHNTPPVPKAPDRILSPSRSPRTPPRVQPDLEPDLTTKLFGQETPLIPSDVPPRLQKYHPPNPTPISPTKPLRMSQRIANWGILTANTCLDDTPAHNRCSQVQHCTITQEAILACLNTHQLPQPHTSKRSTLLVPHRNTQRSP